MPYLIDPARSCPVCGCWLGDRNGTELRACPFGPHDENDYPNGDNAA